MVEKFCTYLLLWMLSMNEPYSGMLWSSFSTRGISKYSTHALNSLLSQSSFTMLYWGMIVIHPVRWIHNGVSCFSAPLLFTKVKLVMQFHEKVLKNFKGLIRLALTGPQELQKIAHLKSCMVHTWTTYKEYFFQYENGSSLLIKNNFIVQFPTF